MNDELKPCPFCGGKPKLGHSSGSWGYYAARDWVECSGCGVHATSFEDEIYDWGKRRQVSVDSKSKAAEAWNRRIGEPAKDQ